MTDVNYTSLLDRALCRLLPVGVTHGVVEIPKKADFEFSSEAELMRTAGDYRKSEFVAGRGCARAALERAGFAREPILSNEDGLPVWPEGALASISHSRGYCAAIASKSEDFRILGLDLEKTNRLSPSAIKRSVHPDEQIYVQSEQKKASLIFCAKEAFFKAQYPVWHTHANFHDLVLSVHEELGQITIQSIDPRFPDDLRALVEQIEFRFSYLGDFVVSACWMSQQDQARSCDHA